MRGWLRRGAAAAGLAADRPDLWIPAGLVSLVFVGWLPFVLVVIPLPGAGDLPFITTDWRLSPLFPWNVIALAGVLAFLVFGGFALAALGEAALLARAGRLTPGWATPGVIRRIGAVFGIAPLPAAVAITLLIAQLVRVAPAEFQSPDVGGGPLLRTALAVAPFVALLGVAIFVGQLVGAPAVRRVAGDPAAGRGGEPLRGALARAIGDLAPAAPQLAGMAAITLIAHLVYAVGVYGVLTVLWRPIAELLSGGVVFDPLPVALLVGFVAIWICLVLGGGAVHAWASVWWSLELAAGRRARPQGEVQSSAVRT